MLIDFWDGFDPVAGTPTFDPARQEKDDLNVDKGVVHLAFVR